MKLILAPVDFSTSTSRVVDEAIRLTRTIEAGHLVLLHIVYPLESLGAAVDPADPGAHRGLLGAVEAGAVHELTKLGTLALGRGVDVHTLCLTGNPLEQIVKQADKLDAACIVIGSRGRTPWAGRTMGTTVNAVVRGAHCPVIVVPSAGGPMGAAVQATIRRESRRKAGDV